MKIDSLIAASALTAIGLAACLGDGKAPEAYARCGKCHGLPGSGDQKGGPDLAGSALSAEDFAKQVKLGSRWKEKDGKSPSYRWKEMPPQTGVSDQEIEQIRRYLASLKK